MIHIKVIQGLYASDEDSTKVFLLDERNGRKAISYSNEQLTSQDLSDKNGIVKVKPFLVLPNEFFDELVKAVLRYANEQNIKSENEHTLEGKLIATEKHLEDMRIITMKTLNIKE